MKVYVKKGDCQSIIPSILLTSFFLVVPIIIYIKLFLGKNFMEALYKNADVFIFSVVFFVLGLFLLFSFFIKPQKFTCKLVSKKEEEYRGKKIFVMIFKFIKTDNNEFDYTPDDCICYTYGDNNFIINENYDVFVKGPNFKPIYVDACASSDTKTLKGVDLLPVFIAVEAILIGFVILGFVGLFYYKENRLLCLIIINVFGIASVYSFVKFKKLERIYKNE